MKEKDDDIAHLGILTGTEKIRNCFAGNTNQQFATHRVKRIRRTGCHFSRQPLRDPLPSASDKNLGFYWKCPHERKYRIKQMSAGTFDRIVLNEAAGACGGRGELRKAMRFK
jgi:hypothetical protein